LVGRQPEKARQIANAASIPWVPSSARDLIKSSEIDAISLAVPPAEQPDLAVLAFEHGKHVLCEKPLAVLVRDARRIADAWKSSGRIGMINFGYRLIPEFVQFKALLREAVCGQVHSICAEWILSTRLDRSLTFHWKGQEDSGGGVLQNFGVHVLDYLFHDSKSVELLGAKRHIFIPERPDSLGRTHHSTGDEIATALYSMDGSTAVMIHMSLVSAPPLGHRLTARGSQGVLELSNLNSNSPAGPFSLRLFHANGINESLTVTSGNRACGMVDIFVRVAERFVNAIRGSDEIPLPSIACGLRACELANEFVAKSRVGV
jgi:predicted dehydrogenase